MDAHRIAVLNAHDYRSLTGLKRLAAPIALAAGVCCCLPLWAAGAAAVPVALGPQELVERALSHNKVILSKRVERDIAATGIERAESAYQSVLNLSGGRGKNRQKNTHEESLYRNNLGIYEREGNDYSVGGSKLFESGGKLEVKTTLSSFLTNNNLLDTTRPPGVLDNRSGVNVSFTQPLARDAGDNGLFAKLRLARVDSSAGEKVSQDSEITAVAETLINYYDLLFSQQQVKAAQERLASGARLLTEVKSMLRQGRVAKADVWEVENSLARYRIALQESSHGARDRLNRLRSLLLLTPADGQKSWLSGGALPLPVAGTVAVDDCIATALQRRADYQWRKLQIEREGIQLDFAHNQALPRVDLVASYGVGGLEYQAREALRWNAMRDYPTWNLGVQVSMPIGENLQAKADIDAAALRRQDALQALKAAETQIVNDIDTSVALRKSVLERWELARQVEVRERQRLELEQRKFALGRSDTREQLQRIEHVINAALAVQEQQAAFAKAEVLLQAAQGVLLDPYLNTSGVKP